MALIEINWNPDARRLRVFGLAALVLLGAAGAWAFLGHRVFGLEVGGEAAEIAAGLLGAGALACGALAVVRPAALRPLYVALTAVTLPIGVVVSIVLLAAVYYGILTPIGLVMRLAGRDPLRRRFDRAAETYWVDRRPVDDIRRYFRQF